MDKMNSSSSLNDSKIPTEAVLNLRDRLRHGQNISKILESQIDTAQQNIKLLQGQVRLATETILNLKKHFQDTENLLSQIVSPDHDGNAGANGVDMEEKENESENTQKHANSNVDSTTRSPIPSEGTVESSKSFEDKNDPNKSPYAQQLRQVLDVLTDEEPRKNLDSQLHFRHSESQSPGVFKDCGGQDCRSQRKQFSSSKCDCGSGSCGQEQAPIKREDYCRSKYKPNGHSMNHHHHHMMHSQKYFKKEGDSPHHSPSTFANHCSGPCCSNMDPHEYSRHYNKGMSAKHGSERHHHHPHCNGEKCQCHNYINYVPYGGGYHVVDGTSSQGMQSEPRHRDSSPVSNRKRQYVPLMPGEEPPHLKYTKVKRIDGNKLTAQKVLQDFTKRRHFSYNPRYDLDLLIVPPPIPAMDLMKGTFQRHQQIPVSKENELQNNRRSPLNSSENTHDDINAMQERGQDIERSKHIAGLQKTLTNHNNNNIYTQHSMYSSPNGKINVMPSIKEEQIDPRSKLDDYLTNLRNEQSNNSPNASSGVFTNHDNHYGDHQEAWPKEMKHPALSNNASY